MIKQIITRIVKSQTSLWSSICGINFSESESIPSSINSESVSDPESKDFWQKKKQKRKKNGMNIARMITEILLPLH